MRIDNDCFKNNQTQIAKILPNSGSLFDLNLDDEDEKLENTCNKTKYNITILYVPQPKKEVDLCNNKTNEIPCIGNSCAKEILKKLFIRELLETKKLKHKLIGLYFERKRKKIKENQKKEKLISSKDSPPLFIQTDIEKYIKIFFIFLFFVE